MTMGWNHLVSVKLPEEKYFNVFRVEDFTQSLESSYKVVTPWSSIKGKLLIMDIVFPLTVKKDEELLKNTSFSTFNYATNLIYEPDKSFSIYTNNHRSANNCKVKSASIYCEAEDSIKMETTILGFDDEKIVPIYKEETGLNLEQIAMFDICKIKGLSKGIIPHGFRINIENTFPKNTLEISTRTISGHIYYYIDNKYDYNEDILDDNKKLSVIIGDNIKINLNDVYWKSETSNILTGYEVSIKREFYCFSIEIENLLVKPFTLNNIFGLNF
jgi:hypothetical protein